MRISAAREGACEVEGLRFHYRRSGGELPVLVGLHGLIGSGACLSALTSSLECGFDVVLPDARGHGDSDKPKSGYSYEALAGDVIGLIEALNLHAPVFLGHSMGGLTAAVAAAKLGGSVRAVVLIDPTFISPAWQQEVFENDVAKQHELALQATKDELFELSRTRHPQRSLELIESLVEARLNTSPFAFEILTPPNPDWRRVVQSIKAPILLLVGDGGVVSEETALELKALNACLQYQVIESAGHGMPYDKPDACGAAVRDFLAGLSEPTS